MIPESVDSSQTFYLLGTIVLIIGALAGFASLAIRRRLEEELPFLVTEAVLMRAVKRGGDRQQLHERIRRHAFAASERMKEGGAENDLVERIAADDAFGLPRSELDQVLDPARHVGRAPQQVDRFLTEVVEPALSRYPRTETTVELRA